MTERAKYMAHNQICIYQSLLKSRQHLFFSFPFAVRVLLTKTAQCNRLFGQIFSFATLCALCSRFGLVKQSPLRACSVYNFRLYFLFAANFLLAQCSFFFWKSTMQRPDHLHSNTTLHFVYHVEVQVCIKCIALSEDLYVYLLFLISLLFSFF